jgi:hypothetical protein
MDHGGEGALPEDVLGLLAADVELVVLDVLGAAVEVAAIDADDGQLAVEAAGEAPPETAADAGDQDGALRRLFRRGRP